MVEFILTFDLKVRSLRVITGSKRSNFDFSIKKPESDTKFAQDFNDVFSCCVR